MISPFRAETIQGEHHCVLVHNVNDINTIFPILLYSYNPNLLNGEDEIDLIHFIVIALDSNCSILLY